MITDLTTRVDARLMEAWLAGHERRHIAAGHIGTHLDTYCQTVIPLSYFRSGGVLVDVADVCEEREIDIDDMAPEAVRPGSFVLFRTARIERHPYGNDEYFRDHPQLSFALIDWLLERGIHFIGVDCCGIRRGEEHAAADARCERAGVYVIENLCNLHTLSESEKPFTMYTMWHDDPAMTGLKCRVLAETE